MSYGDLSMDAPFKPNKGHEGGACNRQSCQAEPALYYNHGSCSWYCADCKRDIGDDSFNKRDWDLNWRPRKGHAMFETREEIDAREDDRDCSPEPTMYVEHGRNSIRHYDNVFIGKYAIIDSRKSWVRANQAPKSYRGKS